MSALKPFGDVILSAPTRPNERQVANHPSLKPQAFLRQIVRAVLPLGEGVVLDPFAGSGSTLAAASAVGYDSVGVELDSRYVTLARKAIPKLAALEVTERSAKRDTQNPTQSRAKSRKGATPTQPLLAIVSRR